MKKHILFIGFLTFLLASCNKGLKTTQVDEEKLKAEMIAKKAKEAMSPIIDRSIFFGNPEISSGQLSPDGNYVTFMREHEGIMNLWVKPFDATFSQATLLTKSPSPILGYFWSQDSKYVLYVNDTGGDENFNVFAVSPSAATASVVPESQNLTPLEDVTAQIYAVSTKDPDLLMIGLNDRDKAWHDLYSLKISTGKLTKIFENNNRYTGYTFDWDDNLRLASRSDEEGNSQILRVEPDGSFEELYTTNLKEQAYVSDWTPDNKECYLITNKGDINFSTCYKMNPETGDLSLYEEDPKGQVDFGGLWVNSDTREIIATSYTYDKRVRYFKDPKWETIYKNLQAKFPGKEIGFTSFTKDYSKMLVSVFGDNKAAEVYFHNPTTDELILQYTPRPALKEIEKHLSTMQPISYPSSDGLSIPAYLSLPTGKSGKNLPVVVLVHGGPKGPRDRWGYRSTVQFLTNRGYAVLQPNFRASGGYGKEFLNAGDKQWGKLMQDDITWGVNHLVAEGIADPKRVAIMGGSYGGYATLAGLAFTPDVYACGVDIVGPSNLFTLLESIPPYWEAGRKWLYEMVGDPDTPEGRKLLTEASPLFSADKISKPLLIIQGANDPRVKKAEADQIVIALRDKGQPVDYLLAMDEGHGFRKPLNRMAMYAQVENFLAQNLGGRYQPDLPEDVSATLRKLTIDIDSVVLESADDTPVLDKIPALNYSWKEGKTDYLLTLDLNGQEMNMSTDRTIRKEGDLWVISDISKTPMGSMKDINYYDKAFNIKKRTIDQAGQVMKFNYEGNKATVSVMGKDLPIESDALLISDGAGMEILVSQLGLKEGDKTAFDVIDIVTMKTKKVIVEHMGVSTYEEKPCQYYVLTSADDKKETTKIWYGDKNEMVKMEVISAAMGYAKMDMVKRK